MSDLRPGIGVALAVFGLPATVTIPGEEPVATTAIWLPPLPVEIAGVLVQTDHPQRALALPRAGLASIEPERLRGTVIELSEYQGAANSSWIVEARISVGVDEVRVVVIPN
ncbi:MAG TPA: hypothetical protein P5144_10380 [Thermoanaerobaculia bacterium]|nr:hypothetical protein [Thermoanaerobaculia bacterium]